MSATVTAPKSQELAAINIVRSTGSDAEREAIKTGQSTQLVPAVSDDVQRLVEEAERAAIEAATLR